MARVLFSLQASPHWMVLFFYLLLLNLAAFFLMGLDKGRAQKKARRLPEALFFMLAACGAVPGLIFAMRSFRHKTRKNAFRYGLPLIFSLQLLALFWLLRDSGF